MPKKRLTPFEKETRKAEDARNQLYFFEEMKPKPPRPVVKKAPWEPRRPQYNERRVSHNWSPEDRKFFKELAERKHAGWDDYKKHLPKK